MDSPPFFFLFSPLLLLLLLHTAGAADHPRISPPPVAGGVNNANLDFLRRSCSTTLYPALCFHSLSRYAASVGQVPSRLALAAVGVSLSNTRRAAAYFSDLTHSSDSSDRRAAAALHDCASTFSDAVAQMRGSLKQLQELGSAGSGDEELRFQLSNVQTWMSAALTYEDTCTDGFDGVPAGRLKNDVCDRVARVSQLTSNALALVNCYASAVN